MDYYDYGSTASTAAGGAVSIITSIICLAVGIVCIIAMWKIFEKAGEAGWKSIIPILNTYTLVKIIDGSGIKFLLLLIPIFGEIYAIILLFRLAKVFGKSAGFGLGLWFLSPIFMIILGFGDAQYMGPLNPTAPQYAQAPAQPYQQPQYPPQQQPPQPPQQ